MEAKTLIKADGISIGYGSRILCGDISFSVREGDCILLCGHNGSGKSTLLRAIADGKAGRCSVSVVMIPTGIRKVRGFTLKEFIGTSLYQESSWTGRIGKELENRISEAISILGLSELQNRDVSTLSDGEFQKGTIAAALCKAGKQGLILLDEPTAFLDPENKINVFRTLKEVAERTGTAFVYSTHDISAALHFCTAAWAFGHDGKFRHGNETKLEVINSIFSDKSFIFGNSTEF